MILQHNSSALVWILLFLVVGMVWYFLDRTFGIRLYRWYFGMTHKDPLSPGADLGFIHGQKARTKFLAAALLSLAQSILIVWSGDSHPLLEMLSWFIEVPLVMAGFYVGPWAWRVWSEKERFFSTVDKLESGDITVSKQIKEAESAARGLFSRIRGFMSNIAKPSRAETTAGSVNRPDEAGSRATAAPETEPPKVPEVVKEKERDPQDFMKDYLRK